jgi:hypothetical protein
MALAALVEVEEERTYCGIYCGIQPVQLAIAVRTLDEPRADMSPKVLARH